MDKLEAMNAFVKVVVLGSYAEASRSLGLTRSAVSKAVMELERLLGARLLDLDRSHECIREGRCARKLCGSQPFAWIDALCGKQGRDGIGAIAWCSSPRS